MVTVLIPFFHFRDDARIEPLKKKRGERGKLERIPSNAAGRRRAEASNAPAR